MEYGFLTLVAPVLALAVAVATRKVPLAMLIGIFAGQMIICGWNPFIAIHEGVNVIIGVCTDAGNLKTFMFTALMGAFVILVRISGGVQGFVNYLTEQSKLVKSKRMAMLLAFIIGVIIFIDGLLSIMFTGVVANAGLPAGLSDKFESLSFHIYYTAAQYQDQEELLRGFGAALVLLGISVGLLFAARLLENGYHRRWRGDKR